MARRSRVGGTAKVRRKLKRMPEEIRKGVSQSIRANSAVVWDEIRANIPRSIDPAPEDWKGRPRAHLQDAIDFKLTLNGTRARIGILTKTQREVFFFAKFLEYGFRGRGSAKGQPKSTVYKFPFFWKSWEVHRERIRRNIKRAASRAFQRAAKG